MIIIILWLLAIISFALAVGNVPRLNWIALGLLLASLTFLLPLIGVR